ncbi:hypothetical protein BACINT_04237 [Bacteroides intestinalis DSM 17393]|uniref:Uncharacterized protein n=1 Tax=Bacteroides intestinalis DSM 17393 TaxID=471870 RepID=B3CEV6_9BACE|nr:hypothetical protein BACINT_04237 [Bacteroides intestinalis DSM 17393]
MIASDLWSPAFITIYFSPLQFYIYTPLARTFEKIILLLQQSLADYSDNLQL